ncbi:nuclear pore complex protein Nup160-like isoform X5 [Saccostrea cucullata]|uniref:nuclear pore complex protein Nup160-like isoform X4 n=1 Tax=Saccostrea cuccullata TaxID=36930 RepID=UPI002ED640BE
MAENSRVRFFREVVVPSNSGAKWKECHINTVASVSTLQDIKVPDSSGGYAYTEGGVTNRFIYWRTTSNILELVEESLDYNLVGSQIRFHFHDTQIIGGISIHESHGNVIVLVVTAISVHRLVFPHPSRLLKNNIGYTQSSHPVPSIFSYASDLEGLWNKYLLNHGGNFSSQIQGAASAQNGEGQALFVLSSNEGSVLLIKMPPLNVQGIVQQFELSKSSMMQKLWTGLVPAAMRGSHESLESATGLVIHPYRGDMYIFAICRDHRLRVWSTRTHECVAVYNVLETCPELKNAPPATGSGHKLVKVMTSDAVNLLLCVHLNFAKRNQFCFLQPQLLSGRVQPVHMATVVGVAEDLIDFCVTSDKLWTLWTNSAGESIARVCHLSGDLRDGNWVEVILHPSDGGEILVSQHTDPREVYMEKMFQPKRFSLYDIHKALNVYRRSMDASVPVDLNIDSLKHEVTEAVEDAIRNSAMANEISEEEYCELQMEQWSKFYSGVVQYQEVGGKMKGYFADSNTGLVCIIKKGGLSYVRPCDPIEELYLGEGHWSAEDLDEITRRDVKTLGRCLSLINSKISEEMVVQFEDQLLMKEQPEEAVRTIVEDLFFNTSLVEISLDSLGALVQNIHDLPNCLMVVLNSLDLAFRAGMEEETDMESEQQLISGQILTSDSAIDLLTTTLLQTSETGFKALRDLLVFLTASISLGDRDGITPEISEAVNELIPRASSLLQSYATLKWASNKVATPSHSNSVELNLRQLATLELTDNSGLTSTQRAATSNLTVAELFIRGIGGNQARVNLTCRERFLDNTRSQICSWAVLGITRHIQLLLWPLNETFVFPEFLASCCQYLPLQEYSFLLNHWCDVNPASRKFMLGLCYLHFGEPEKAAQCYTEAKEGLETEPFLRQSLLQTDETSPRTLEVLYYLKVIRQFEELDCADTVVHLARTAISIADEDDENTATLWSKMFKYQLELGHNDEAYNAMVSNPDPSRRKDCLRQLLVTLCERGDLQTLVGFPYIDLQDEVVSILESRARAVDITTQNYYDLLYAYYVSRNNFGKAGSVMYEHGMRLGREVPSKQGLQKQAHCYLAAMNALRLVNPMYAWIVRPTTNTDPQMVKGIMSGKRNIEGDEKENQTPKRMEVLELKDIEKEFMLVDARLQLLKHDTTNSVGSGPTPGADEMVGLLVNAGMYDRALTICQMFDMKLTSVFDSLALRCVNLAKSCSHSTLADSTTLTRAWDWLKLNNLTAPSIKESSAADTAWSLLQYYLRSHEDNTARLHRTIVIRLLSQGFPLPSWLVKSYKELNWSELLRLYTDYDQLEDAVMLTIEYVDALLGTYTGPDCPAFNIKSSLRPTPLNNWLPYTCIDQLLRALKDVKQDILYERLSETLEYKLANYHQKMRNISDRLLMR